MADTGALDEHLELFAQLLQHRWQAGKNNGITRQAVEDWVLEGEPSEESDEAPEEIGEIEDVVTYTMQPKDNLWKIARQWLRTQLDHEPSNIEIWRGIFAIAKENEIADVKIIHPRTVLHLPEAFANDGAD